MPTIWCCLRLSNDQTQKELQSIIAEAQNDPVNIFRTSVNELHELGEGDLASLLASFSTNDGEDEYHEHKLRKSVTNAKHCKPRGVHQDEMKCMIEEKKKVKRIRAAKFQRRLYIFNLCIHQKITILLPPVTKFWFFIFYENKFNREKHERRQAEAFAASPAGIMLNGISDVFFKSKTWRSSLKSFKNVNIWRIKRPKPVLNTILAVWRRYVCVCQTKSVFHGRSFNGRFARSVTARGQIGWVAADGR